MIDPALTPIAPQSVLPVEVDGELVLYDRATDAFHALNSTAALLWGCCDGTATVAELIRELAEAFGEPEPRIREGVGTAVEELLDTGLLVRSDANATQRFSSRPSPADLGTPCVPCQAKLDGLDWAGSVSVRVGELRTGVRATSPAAVAVIERLLAEHLSDDPDGPVHYSVALHDTAADPSGPPRALHQLFFSSRLLARSRNPARILRALVAHLDGHLDAHRTDRLMVGGRLVTSDAGSLLVAQGLSRALDAAEPRLRRHGISVSDAPSVALGAPGEIVLHLPALSVDHAVLAELDEPDGVEPAQPAPGARPLVAWLVPGVPCLVGPVERSAALGVVTATVRNLDAFGPRAALDHVAAHVAKSPVLVVGTDDPGELPATVRRLLVPR